jgi:predicted ribosome quality control (RQC) complex YloA/Tae2 family protein
MEANYYTLLHIARDLDERLRGKSFLEIFSQRKNELIMHFSDEQFLVVSCEPSENYLYARGSFARAKKNSLDFFPTLIGQTVESVSMSLTDREIFLKTSDGSNLIVQMFGSKANVLLLHTNYRIQASFLKPKHYVGTVYAPHNAGDLGFANEEELRARLAILPEASRASALKKVFPRFGKELVQELLFRANLSPESRVAESDIAPLYKAHVTMLSSLMVHPSPRIYFEGNHPRTFSPIALDHLQHLRVETFDSIHDALHAFITRRLRNNQFLKSKAHLSDTLERELSRTEKTIRKLQEDLQSANRAGQYELSGKLIMAHLDFIRKGQTEAEFANVFGDDQTAVRIALEPDLSARQNAERYFQKAKKARGAVEENKSRLADLMRTAQKLRELHQELEEVEHPDEFHQFLGRHREVLAERGIRTDRSGKKAEQERIPFRIFTVAGGFQVWVGKNSENNDVLTMNYAKPNDLWFHARSSSGSHVVLKIGTGKGAPSKLALHQAAAIAAFYSKMKNSKTVPVAMTARKYVRKPRGANPGSVIVEREKVLFVEPALPHE